MIFEVVDPLTKKQFMGFQQMDSLRKKQASLSTKLEDLNARLDKTIKRNEALDVLERRVKELDEDIHITRALQRNDNVIVLEKIETLQARLRVAQSDLTGMSKYDEKLKQLQQSIFDITDEYNITVAARIKEVSAGFIKQVQELDLRYRESHRDLQEVLIKIDRVHEFTQSNEDRFNQLQAFINDLRETFEETRIAFAAKGAVNAEESQLEDRLRAKVQVLERQVAEFKRTQAETDEQLKNHLHSVTNNRIEQLIYQNQIELFERVFSVKALNFHINGLTESPISGVNKRAKRDTMGDYMVQVTNNFKLWRNIQVDKGRYEVMELFSNEDYTKPAVSDHTRRLSTLMGRLMGAQKTPRSSTKHEEDVSETERLRQQQKQLLEQERVLDEETKKRLQDLQIID